MLKNWGNKKERQTIFRVLYITNIAALILLLLDVSASMKSYHQIPRNNYGKGTKVESLVVSDGAELKKEPIDIKVEEQVYTEKEIKKVFKKSMEELDKIVLGNNKKPDDIRDDLYLPGKMPDKPIEIAWELDNYDVINLDGTLLTDNLNEGGTLVEVKGTLSYKKEKAQYITTVKVYPPHMNKKQQTFERVKKEVAGQDEETRESKNLLLPKKINGNPITWKRPFQKRAFAISFLGVLGAGLLIALKKQNEIKKEQDKRRQMMIDYPEIINQFSLLVSAGMTVKNAWKKIVTEYQMRCVTGKERYAYEEMKYTYREMQSGVAEGESYERFGYRCKVQNYIKFGSLLSQNLRKGSKGLVALLTVESAQAFDNRKSLAKKLGEEAGTKLLIPMFCMLGIVLVIVVVPAFLSMQI